MDQRIQQYCDECEEAAAYDARQRMGMTLGRCLPDCESEIERLFLAALLRLEALNNTGPILEFDVCCGAYYSKRAHSFEEVRGGAWDNLEYFFQQGFITSKVFVFPQVTFEPYRVDFLLGRIWRRPGEDDAPREQTEHWIAVECDGHEFHDKTKEQAQRDKARDRFLVTAGVKVMRFTGSEIWRDPTACALEALNAVHPAGNWVTGFGS